MNFDASLRDYGYPESPGVEPVGKPKARPIEDEETKSAVLISGGCPHCGCLEIMEISVPMKNPLLRGGEGVGNYLGCPACPWASPMMTHSVDAPKIVP